MVQAIKNATAVFCIACICAEVVSRLTGEGWPRRCIKAASGLYILAILLCTVPGIETELEAFSYPQTSARDFGTLEQAVINSAQAQLEQTLETQCFDETGVAVRLHIALEQNGDKVEAASVRACLPESCSEADISRIASFLRQALGTEPELIGGEGGA